MWKGNEDDAEVEEVEEKTTLSLVVVDVNKKPCPRGALSDWGTRGEPNSPRPPMESMELVPNGLVAVGFESEEPAEPKWNGSSSTAEEVGGGVKRGGGCRDKVLPRPPNSIIGAEDPLNRGAEIVREN